MGLHGADCDAVHHLESGGHDPVSDDGRHRLARGLDAWKGREHGRDAGRDAKEPDLDLRDRAQRAFRADEHAAEIKPDAVGSIAADPMHAAVGQHHLHAQDVVGGDTVIKAVRAA